MQKGPTMKDLPVRIQTNKILLQDMNVSLVAIYCSVLMLCLQQNTPLVIM